MTDTNSEDEKRTRTFTVHTSVEGLRKPITSDATDESRVQNDTIFVCISCDEKFLSFRQTLQRINALNRTARGVAVAPRSLPMTPTRTTPARGPLRAASPCLRHLPFELRSSAHGRGKYSKFRGDLAPRNQCSIVRMFGLLDWRVRDGRGRRGSLRTGQTSKDALFPLFGQSSQISFHHFDQIISLLLDLVNMVSIKQQ